jgi:hypothetical protein
METKAKKESLDKEIQERGKEANLLYKASQDGFSRKVFYEKCLGQKETIVLVQTDKNSVIGGYCPEKWEDTNDDLTS